MTKDDLEYVWKSIDPVQIVQNLHLPEHTLEMFRTGSCDVTTAGGKNK